MYLTLLGEMCRLPPAAPQYNVCPPTALVAQQTVSSNAEVAAVAVTRWFVYP